MRVIPSVILSNWRHSMRGLQLPTEDFYGKIEEALNAEQAEHVKVERVIFAEGGVFSSKREYLQVRRGDYVFHICAAPFGSGFFVSWWLGYAERGLFAWLATLPYVGIVFRLLRRPITYYKLDTAHIFQALTASCVEHVLNAEASTKGLRGLTDEECKPTTIRDLMAARA